MGMTDMPSTETLRRKLEIRLKRAFLPLVPFVVLAILVAYVASMPDCRKRIERFVALSDLFRGTEIRFVAVDIGSLESDKFPELLPEDRGKVLFLNDRTDELRRALKIDITPTTFLVSANGKIQDRIDAVYTWDQPDFRRRVDTLGRNR